MSDEKYPYVNHMNILYEPLQLIDIQSLVDQCTDQWYNQTLCQVNDSVVRLGILHGEYHWHKHDKEDEFFFTLDGRLIIDLEDRESEKTVVLMIETAGIVPTGDE
jgi:dTDP-4-dehydrorhamnose 3,5-epimerase-like enzyme